MNLIKVLLIFSILFLIQKRIKKVIKNNYEIFKYLYFLMLFILKERATKNSLFNEYIYILLVVKFLSH